MGKQRLQAPQFLSQPGFKSRRVVSGDQPGPLSDEQLVTQCMAQTGQCSGDGRRGHCQPVGCRECRDVGYRGRLGVYELLVVDDELRQLAHDRVSTWEIKKAAIDGGMKTLRDDGWAKVLLGHTSIDEILRITKGDRV